MITVTSSAWGIGDERRRTGTVSAQEGETVLTRCPICQRHPGERLRQGALHESTSTRPLTHDMRNPLFPRFDRPCIGIEKEQGGAMYDADVVRVPMASPGDISGVAELFQKGKVAPEHV